MTMLSVRKNLPAWRVAFWCKIVAIALLWLQAISAPAADIREADLHAIDEIANREIQLEISPEL
jgi:hypothetical protein